MRKTKALSAKIPACDTIRYKRKVPDLNIWTAAQLEKFLNGVRESDMDWYYIFAFAVLTGCRAGELWAIQWKNIDLKNKLLKVVQSYSQKTREIIPTKNREIRNVPINADLMRIIKELKIKSGGKPNDYVLPQPHEFTRGEQAKVLQMYAKLLGLPQIRFHDLRAIFACQLHLSGVGMHIVKAICGWANLATVERYMRLAGSEVLGATDNLKFKIPNEKPAKVVGLNSVKKRKRRN